MSQSKLFQEISQGKPLKKREVKKLIHLTSPSLPFKKRRKSKSSRNDDVNVISPVPEPRIVLYFHIGARIKNSLLTMKS